MDLPAGRVLVSTATWTVSRYGNGGQTMISAAFIIMGHGCKAQLIGMTEEGCIIGHGCKEQGEECRMHQIMGHGCQAQGEEGSIMGHFRWQRMSSFDSNAGLNHSAGVWHASDSAEGAIKACDSKQ